MTIEPLDHIHAEAIVARAEIRAAFIWLKAQAAVWEPRPMPPHYTTTERNRT